MRSGIWYLLRKFEDIINKSNEGKCGPNFGKCPNNGCCSQYGYCGTSDEYCGAGCNPKCGLCFTSDGTCGIGKGRCPEGQCCSQYGYCGKSGEYCEAGCNPSFGDCENYIKSKYIHRENAIYDIQNVLNMSSQDSEMFFDDTDEILSSFFEGYITSLINKNKNKNIFDDAFYNQCPKHCINAENQLKKADNNTKNYFNLEKFNKYLNYHNQSSITSTRLANICIRYIIYY